MQYRFNQDVYKRVKGNWVISLDKANKIPYVLAVQYGLVVGAFKVNKNGWKKCENSKRKIFDGEEAPEEVKNYFMMKKIPERYGKVQNPVCYCRKD